jgi:hypothetical protein
MNKLTPTTTIFFIHLTLLGFFIGIAFWDASQKIQQFDRTHTLMWPAGIMVAWIIYFYLFWILYSLMGSDSPNKFSACSVIVSALILTGVQIFSGFPTIALAFMPGDFALRPITKFMKTHESGAYYKTEKPYVFIDDAEKMRGRFHYKNTDYLLSADSSFLTLCMKPNPAEHPVCLQLPRISEFEGKKAAQFFTKNEYLYISLPSVGIWRINIGTFEHDSYFFKNILKAHNYINEKDYTGDSQFYLMKIEDRLVLRFGLWVYSTDLDGNDPRPLAFDRANGLEIDT